QATRRVCKLVPTTVTRKVCEDKGHYETVMTPYTVGCGDCAQTCYKACRKWVPNVVTTDVQCTVMQPQTEEVPYQYQVTLCRPETRTREVQVCRLVAEQQTKQ